VSPSGLLFISLKILKLWDIHNMQIAIFMYKLKCCQLPASFNHYAVGTSTDRTHNTRHIRYFIRIRSLTYIH